MSKPENNGKATRPSKAYVEALEAAVKDAVTFLRDSHIPDCRCPFCTKSREIESVLRQPQRIV